MSQRRKPELGSLRAFAAIRSSPVSMVGDSSLCIEGRILPLNGAHVSHEQFNFRWPLPRVAAFHSIRRDVLEGLAVHSCCSAVGFAAFVGKGQNVFSIHLVVQSVETKVR